MCEDSLTLAHQRTCRLWQQNFCRKSCRWPVPRGCHVAALNAASGEGLSYFYMVAVDSLEICSVVKIVPDSPQINSEERWITGFIPCFLRFCRVLSRQGLGWIHFCDQHVQTLAVLDSRSDVIGRLCGEFICIQRVSS